jgi:hypothetical protein
MESFIIIILAMILIIFISLNYYKSQKPIPSRNPSLNPSLNPPFSPPINPPINIPPSCARTRFGCCTNGIDSRINFNGTNCPGYIPEPINVTVPVIVKKTLPPPPQNLPPPPHPNYNVPKPLPIGGCEGTKYGCCPNRLSAKFNEVGTNCVK